MRRFWKPGTEVEIRWVITSEKGALVSGSPCSSPSSRTGGSFSGVVFRTWLRVIMKANKADSTRTRGLNAENIATESLKSQGYHILERNFRCKLGEIDIIARDGREVVFVEVRSRHSEEALDPVYTINYRKRKKIVQVAQVYLSSRFVESPTCRFDVVIVTLIHPPRVEVIKDAFGLE